MLTRAMRRSTFFDETKPSGVIGVVGDIIIVPKGYEVAIETALGAMCRTLYAAMMPVQKKQSAF